MRMVKCPSCSGTGKVEFSVGMMIAAARRAAGLTQTDVAERVGICRAQLANIETGRSGCSTRRLVQIADALGVKAGNLFP